MSPLSPPNPYIAGNALKGEERGFFGREDILHEVELTLHRPNDNAIVIYGQRRIGKTSILLQLQHRLPTPPFVPIYFDLMLKARTPINDVLYDLVVTAATEVGIPLPKRTDFENNPEAFHSVFLPTLYQVLGNERRPVFLLDEFDVLDIAEHDLPETAAARAFRPYLYRLQTTEPRLAFVFVVGRRMEELSAGFLANFKAASSLLVSALPHEEARALILLAEREGTLHYEESAVERILAITRGHPFFTQLICQLLFNRAYGKPTNQVPIVTASDVETIIPKALATGGHAFQWIWDGLPPAERIIFSAVATKSEEGKLLSEGDITTVLQDVGIRILVREFTLAPQTLVNWQMLEQIDGGYRFFVELMRRWVAANRPLDKVKDELDRINPLADSLYQAALGYHRQGNNERAMAQLRETLNANLNHLKARLLLGTILRDEGRLAEAVAEFEQAYEIEPREAGFELLRTLLQQGETLEAAGAEQEALTAYNRVLEIFPREKTAQDRRSALWEKQGDRALAIPDFEAAIAAYDQAGAEAKLEQTKAQKRKRELEQLAKEAETYETQQKWAQATEIYRRLTELDPGDKRWAQALQRTEEELWLAKHYAEGAGYLRQEEWDKAQRTLAAVISKRYDYQNAAELLAQAKQRGKGQIGELRRYWLPLIMGGAAILLLAIAGVWGYSQSQNQAELTSLANTAVAQATAAEIAALTRTAATAAAQATAAEEVAITRVAVAIQGTQLAELRGTQTAEAQAAQIGQAQDAATAAAIATQEKRETSTAEVIAQATQSAEVQLTANAAVAATQTAQAPTPTSIPTQTPRPTRTPTPTATPIPASAILYSEDFEDGSVDRWVVEFGDWSVVKEDGNQYWRGSGPENYPQA